MCGFGIALAWPETYCKQAGAWYDSFLNDIGIAKNNYYKVGHAAVILIDKDNLKCHYFDFGRYHAPFRHGRVRSAETDYELEFHTKPKISDNGKEIVNLDEILTELQSSEVFHGSGKLFASYVGIDFKKAYVKAISMQNKCPLAYGPFRYGGSNCSRFVNTVLRVGKPKLAYWFKLLLFNPLTPTPMNNVNALKHKQSKAKMYVESVFVPPLLSKAELKSVMKAPIRNSNIPQKAIWHSGEGAGSWFVINYLDNKYIIERYAPSGKLESSGIYKLTNITSTLNTDILKIDYISHSKTVKIVDSSHQSLCLQIL